MPVASLCRLGTAAPVAPGARPHRRSRSIGGAPAAGRRSVAARADADANANAKTNPPPPPAAAAPPVPELPKRGLFALADPTAEVYGKAGAEPFDPSKKPKGRYAPEFLWNTDWRGTLKRQEDLERQMRDYEAATSASGATGSAEAIAPAPLIAGGSENALPPLGAAVVSPGVAQALAERRAAQRGAGRVALSRLSVLEDASADLSAELAAAEAAARRRKAAREAQMAAAAESAGINAASSSAADASAPRRAPRRRPQAAPAGAPAVSPSYRLKDLPSRGELRRFARSTRSANAAANAVAASAQLQMAMTPEERAERDREAAEANARYEKLKIEFQGWTLGMGALGTAAAYFAYSPQTAVSYAIGASSGLTYLRLLGRSVDALGGGGGAGSAVLGQPRLLVPVVMALSYNRWNLLYADEYGLALELLPMLAGFFTYKLAVLARQGLELLSELSEGDKKSKAGGESGAGGEESRPRLTQDPLKEGYVSESMTLDRIFVKRVIKEM